MGDIIYDIQQNMKQFKTSEYYSVIEKLSNDLSEYDYDVEYINAPTACGDTNKSTTEYTIGEYDFKYEHMCGDAMVSAKFQMRKDEDEFEILYKWGAFMELRNVLAKIDNEDTVFNATESFKEMCNRYQTDDDIILTFLTILNAFTTGHSVSIHKNPDSGEFHTNHTPLYRFIDIERYVV